MGNAGIDSKRWRIAAAAVVMQLCLGSVYAWSIFKIPLMDAHGWKETQTQVAFMTYSFMFALSVALGGALIDRKGPRFVGLSGGLLFGCGLMLAGYADTQENLFMLYGAYGLIAGLGGGLGYVTPITTLIRWFPDKRGLVTGLAVMGYGFGSFIMGNVGPSLIISLGIAATFILWGIASLLLIFLSVLFFRNPPVGWQPEITASPNSEAGENHAPSFTFTQAAGTVQFWTMWGIVFLLVTAGLGIISQLSPMARDVMLLHVQGSVSKEKMAAIAVASGSVVAIAAVFNGIGRLLWAWVSDAVGRKQVFAILFITGAAGFLLLGRTSNIILFTMVVSYLLACYGGGLACMPAFAADVFGHEHIGKIYGVIFSACGPAGIVGPFLFASMKEMTGSFKSALCVESVFLGLSFILIYTFRNPVRERHSI